MRLTVLGLVTLPLGLVVTLSAAALLPAIFLLCMAVVHEKTVFGAA